MRICSIITSFTTGGAEVLVSNLSHGFGQAGHASAVVALSDAAVLGNSVETERAMMARIRGAGAQALSLGLANRRNVLAGAFRLRRRLAEFRPDVIHAHTAQAALMLALLRPRAPVVLTHHNSVFSFPLALFRVFDAGVFAYVGISPSCTRAIVPHVRRPVITIPNGAPPCFRAERPRSLPAGDPWILSVGAISDQKDYRTLIRSGPVLCALLSATGRRPRIRIVGGGAQFRELQEFARREGGGAVDLLGERDDVVDLLQRAHLYVNSSRYEGLPVSIIEALMSGLPVVATDVAGNRDLVTPGSNGLLVPDGDPVALARAMAEILADAGRYAALSRGAIETSRRHTIEAAVDAHLRLYARALAEDRAPAGRQRVPVTVGLNPEG